MKPDRSKLSPDQLDKLDAWQASQDQLQTLQDIATMTQEVIGLMDEGKKTGAKTTGDMGALLLDIRESLDALKAKEAPAVPDFAKPVVEAVSKLQTALSAQIKAIELKPVIDAPQVNVSPASVDLKGVERALGTLPEAFNKAIKLIPKTVVPKTDFSPLLKAWEGISEQLLSIETGVRMKPQPGTMKVTNTDGSDIRIPSIWREYDGVQFTNADSNGNYQTITFSKGLGLVGTLTLTYDGSSNPTSIARS